MQRPQATQLQANLWDRSGYALPQEFIPSQWYLQQHFDPIFSNKNNWLSVELVNSEALHAVKRYLTQLRDCAVLFPCTAFSRLLDSRAIASDLATQHKASPTEIWCNAMLHQIITTSTSAVWAVNIVSAHPQDGRATYLALCDTLATAARTQAQDLIDLSVWAGTAPLQDAMPLVHLPLFPDTTSASLATSADPAPSLSARDADTQTDSTSRTPVSPDPDQWETLFTADLLQLHSPFVSSAMLHMDTVQDGELALYRDGDRIVCAMPTSAPPFATRLYSRPYDASIDHAFAEQSVPTCIPSSSRARACDGCGGTLHSKLASNSTCTPQKCTSPKDRQIFWRILGLPLRLLTTRTMSANYFAPNSKSKFAPILRSLAASVLGVSVSTIFPRETDTLDDSSDTSATSADSTLPPARQPSTSVPLAADPVTSIPSEASSPSGDPIPWVASDHPASSSSSDLSASDTACAATSVSEQPSATLGEVPTSDPVAADPTTGLRLADHSAYSDSVDLLDEHDVPIRYPHAFAHAYPTYEVLNELNSVLLSMSPSGDTGFRADKFASFCGLLRRHCVVTAHGRNSVPQPPHYVCNYGKFRSRTGAVVFEHALHCVMREQLSNPDSQLSRIQLRDALLTAVSDQYHDKSFRRFLSKHEPQLAAFVFGNMRPSDLLARSLPDLHYPTLLYDSSRPSSASADMSPSEDSSLEGGLGSLVSAGHLHRQNRKAKRNKRSSGSGHRSATEDSSSALTCVQEEEDSRTHTVPITTSDTLVSADSVSTLDLDTEPIVPVQPAYEIPSLGPSILGEPWFYTYGTAWTGFDTLRKRTGFDDLVCELTALRQRREWQANDHLWWSMAENDSDTD